MKTKNYFALMIALFICTTAFVRTEKPVDQKAILLEKMHWLIERSDMNTVREGFDRICRENNFPSMVAGLRDGHYKGATPDDDYGYRHEVQFEMKNGKMISIDYDEIHHDGHAKQSDKAYGERMLKSGTSPAIAYPKYESQMLEKQNYNQVDGVSGASYSLYRFKLAILYAILNSGQL
ncbi:MAG TPA: hypothetical protein VGK10_17980 [Prolixibacteraceae bacterium]|jgi:major membrane immunogen (membrane-anchored lipoprotein)